MRRSSPLFYIFSIAILFIICSLGFFLFRNNTAPKITLTPEFVLEGENIVLSPYLEITVIASSSKSSIHNISVQIERAGRIIPIKEKTYSKKRSKQSMVFSIKGTGITKGECKLEVTVTDNSFGTFGRGNKTQKIIPVTLDPVVPKAFFKTSKPSIRKGGTACILYSLNKQVVRTGIQVSNRFYPAFEQSNGDFLCFFPFPYNMTIKNFQPQLIATDKAGNTLKNFLDISKINREFKHDSLPISQGFLNSKASEFEKMSPEENTDIERFLKINKDIRKNNVEKLLDIGKHTAKNIMWSGLFMRLPRSANRSGYADHRTYTWNGEKIDEQTHLGLDLASTAQAPVPAANNGTVIFAEYLGIYGNLVIIDHGAGLQSLYSHLSEINVEVGQSVKKGDIIARTGKTGMAGGDHLHFGILVHGVEVTPIEWLDPKWIRENITLRLKNAGFENS